ncbi:hypothetical protein BDAP_001478 [Binucleata daphniae]
MVHDEIEKRKATEFNKKMIIEALVMQQKKNINIPNKRKENSNTAKEKAIIKYLAQRRAKKSGAKSKQHIEIINIEEDKNVYLEVSVLIDYILHANIDKYNVVCTI